MIKIVLIWYKNKKFTELPLFWTWPENPAFQDWQLLPPPGYDEDCWWRLLVIKMQVSYLYAKVALQRRGIIGFFKNTFGWVTSLLMFTFIKIFALKFLDCLWVFSRQFISAKIYPNKLAAHEHNHADMLVLKRFRCIVVDDLVWFISVEALSQSWVFF